MEATSTDHRAASPADIMTGLRPLWATRLELLVTPRSRMRLPVLGRAHVLRGGFGLTLRRLVCHDIELECARCDLRPRCVYPEIFAPSPPGSATQLTRASDLPRPFVFAPGLPGEDELRPGDRTVFRMAVVGKAIHRLPYLVAAFRNLADAGLGPDRARFRLQEVRAVGPHGLREILFEEGGPVRMPQTSAVRVEDLVAEGDLRRTQVTLRFHTPTEIKDGAQVMTEPQMPAIVRRLRDRLSALAVFFADGPLALPFKELGALADHVQLTATDAHMLNVKRTSTRTRQTHGLSGFIGSATYVGGAVGTLMPLLRWAEVLHVGKHAAFGNGAVEVVE